MIRNRRGLLACLALLLSSLILSGCGQGTIANRKYFLLDTTRPAAPASFHSKATLRVRQLHADQAFAGRQLVYRVDVSRYEPDFYDEFLIPPGVMIAEKTRDWLADSDLFQRVYSSSGPLQSTYALEGNIMDMYGDFTKGAAPQAIMEIRFYLLASPDFNETVVLAKTYEAKSPIAAHTAEAVVDALSKDLMDILARLEADIEKKLRQGNEQGG